MKKYYLMAIDKDYTDAMYNLGFYYQITKKNYDKMKKYYLMAIDKGDTDSIENIRIYIKYNCNDIDKITLYNDLLKINKKNNSLKKIIIELEKIIKTIDINKVNKQCNINQLNIFNENNENNENNICECLICYEKKEYVLFDECNHKVCKDCFIQIENCPYRCL